MSESDDSKHDDPAAEEGSAGSADPSRTFRENPPDDGEVKEIEEERERRLDAENRPEGVEIDNTGRTFDQDAWEFDDGEGGQGGVVDPTQPASERGHGPDGAGDGQAGGEAGGGSGEDDG
ncbi:MAG: hypothetical protein ACRDOM_04550 [Nocardioides sp.]